MGVSRENAIGIGSLVFLVVFIVFGTIIALYSRARTKDPSMKRTNCL
jgi:hypothetical protein